MGHLHYDSGGEKPSWLEIRALGSRRTGRPFRRNRRQRATHLDNRGERRLAELFYSPPVEDGNGDLRCVAGCTAPDSPGPDDVSGRRSFPGRGTRSASRSNPLWGRRSDCCMQMIWRWQPERAIESVARHQGCVEQSAIGGQSREPIASSRIKLHVSSAIRRKANSGRVSPRAGRGADPGRFRQRALERSVQRIYGFISPSEMAARPAWSECSRTTSRWSGES